MQGFHCASMTGPVGATEPAALLTTGFLHLHLFTSCIHISILTHDGQIGSLPPPFITSLRHSAAEMKEINGSGGTREKMQSFGGWRRSGEPEEPSTVVSTLTEDAHHVSAPSRLFPPMWEYESGSNAWLARSLSELKRIAVILSLSLSSRPSLCCHHYICLRGDSQDFFMIFFHICRCHYSINRPVLEILQRLLPAVRLSRVCVCVCV